MVSDWIRVKITETDIEVFQTVTFKEQAPGHKERRLWGLRCRARHGPIGCLYLDTETEAREVLPLMIRAWNEGRRLLRKPWRVSSRTRNQERRTRRLADARDMVLRAARAMVTVEAEVKDKSLTGAT